MKELGVGKSNQGLAQIKSGILSQFFIQIFFN